MGADKIWKAASMAASVGAGIAARNAAQAMWRMRRGQEPPANPADPNTGWGEAIGWTLFVGALVGVARLFARRGAAGVWEAVEGHKPPGVGIEDDHDTDHGGDLADAGSDAG